MPSLFSLFCRPDPVAYVAPFFAWPGSKRQLRAEILHRLPGRIRGTYREPFLGGGSVALALLAHPERFAGYPDSPPSPDPVSGPDPGHILGPTKIYLSDINPDLITTYHMARNCTEPLIGLLQAHISLNSETFYYTMRDQDPVCMSNLDRAARFLYLNGAAWKRLWRVSAKGKMNAPYGHNDFVFAQPHQIRDAIRVLNRADVQIQCASWQTAFENVQIEDVIYADPPYIPRHTTASFVGYAEGGFDQAAQVALAMACKEAANRGARVLVSNSDTPLTRDIYRDADRIESVGVRYGIGHETVREVLISYNLVPLHQAPAQMDLDLDD